MKEIIIYFSHAPQRNYLFLVWLFLLKTRTKFASATGFVVPGHLISYVLQPRLRNRYGLTLFHALRRAPIVRSDCFASAAINQHESIWHPFPSLPNNNIFININIKSLQVFIVDEVLGSLNEKLNQTGT